MTHAPTDTEKYYAYNSVVMSVLILCHIKQMVLTGEVVLPLTTLGYADNLKTIAHCLICESISGHEIA